MWFPRCSLTPAAGAAVMSTGILSVGLQLGGAEAISQALLAIAVGQWLILNAVFGNAVFTHSDRWRAEAHAPTALTAVAATAVLGVRLAAAVTALAWVTLVTSTVAWMVLTPLVLRARLSWRHGGAFLTCVSTQGLAVLLATLAAPYRLRWAAHAGFGFFVLGIVFYGWVLRHFDWLQIARGAGDQWVLGGALAISSLAGAKLILAERQLGLSSVRRELTAIDMALWSLSALAYLVLAAAELRWPRRRYDVRRWATVFPMGMTAVATYAVAQAEALPTLRAVAALLVAAAGAAWCLASCGAVRSVLRRGR